MSDTLVIFGITFPNANGFKVTDNNGTVQTYVKNDGGSGSGSEDMPTFTATYNGSTVTAVTCDKTFAECYSYIYDDGIASAKIAITDGQYSYDTYVEYISISSSSIVYSGLLSEDGIPMLKITYPSSGSITYSYDWLSKKTSSDLNISGATVTAPAGYYLSNALVSVTTMTLPTSAAASATSGYTSKATISRSTSDQYINIPPGYNSTGGYYKVSAVANGTEGTPTATKGTVSNHQVLVAPSVTNTAGYISGSTKTGTAVTVSVGELVSGTKSITQNGTSILVAEYEYVDVAVPTGTSKNFQVSNTQVRIANKTALTDTGLTLTVAETGTYNVYWSAFRTNSSSGYTWGTQLYIGTSSYGSENTSWNNNYNQVNKLTNVSLTKDQVLHVYGRTRNGSSYYICCSNLILEQTS